MQTNVAALPLRPDGVKPIINRQLTDEFITVKGYGSAYNSILSSTADDVELTINLETYERMENDPTITKSKKIILTNVLTDEIQFAPSANEDDVGPKEFANYVEIMEHCERCITGLDTPFRGTLEQLLGNGIRYGHGIGEIEWELRYDTPKTKPMATTSCLNWDWSKAHRWQRRTTRIYSLSKEGLKSNCV